MKKMYVLLIAAFILSSHVFAQTGVIDGDFANKGIATSAYNTIQMNGHTSALQPDGKIIMVGGNGSNQVTLVRYSSSGFIDNSFGTNGEAVITAPSGFNLGGTSTSLAVQADGKIVYASNALDKIVLLRLKINGTQDSSFGTSGISYTGVSAGWSSQVGKVIVKANGRILTGGTGTYASDKYFEVAQFLSNGKIDSSFAVNGFYHYNAGQQGGCFSIALMPNGHIAAGGMIFNLIGSLNVINLLANGSVDNTYGTNGIATSLPYTTYRSISCRLVIQPDSKVVAMGYASYGGGQGIGVVRFKANGQRDSSFAWQGTLTTTFKDLHDLPQNVALQPDGKVVISGSTSGKFALMRLQSNGTTDSTYGRIGKVVTNMPGTGSYIGYSFMQPDGKMVLTGISNINSMYNFVAGRFESSTVAYYNTLKGSFFSDDNHNGIRDANEMLLSNVKTSVRKNRFDSLSAISSNGQFNLQYLDTGAYVCNAIVQSSCYSTPIPANHVTNYTTYFNVDSVTFAMQPAPCFRDLGIDLITCHRVRPRPGMPLYYSLYFGNAGTDIAAGTVQFVKSSKLDFDHADMTPASINGDTVRWNFSGLLPQQMVRIYLFLTVKMPPFANINDSLISVATIKSDTAYEANLQNNISKIKQIVVNSYDPNNKIENHGGTIAAAQVAGGEYLTYTINFQNTGTDTAYDVFVHDTLSDKLDWTTLEMINASSNYQLVMNEGKCVWSFKNIYLPDSIVNLEGSHGYVSYRIKPKANVQIGDVIKSAAAIYFDYNLPIYTNAETTTIVADALPLKLLSFTAKKEGRTNLLNWSTVNEINVDHFDVERSANGREFTKIGATKATNYAPLTAHYTFTDFSPLTSSNYYRLKMMDKDGQSTYSPVRLVSNNSNYIVSVYPNPAKDNLQIQIESEMRGQLQIVVLSGDGKVVLSSSFTANEGSNLQSMNISTLPKGSYFLKIISASGKEEQVMKFEKF